MDLNETDRDLLNELCDRAGIPAALTALADRCAFEAAGENRAGGRYEQAAHALIELARTLEW